MPKKKEGKGENGRWDPAFIKNVLSYAHAHYDAAAIRKYKVPATTFYAWKRQRAKNRK